MLRIKMYQFKQETCGEKLQELAMYILNEFYVLDITSEGSYDDEQYINCIYDILCDKISVARKNIEEF